MPLRRTRSWLLRWGGIAATLLLALLYAANKPFYAGQSIGRWGWRLEHGRLLVKHSQHVGRESFYIAINSEPMRFRPDWRFQGWNDWHVNIPLWAPLLISTSITAWSWARRPHKRRAGSCPKCGYDLAGLAAASCPECGGALNPPAST